MTIKAAYGIPKPAVSGQFVTSVTFYFNNPSEYSGLKSVIDDYISGAMVSRELQCEAVDPAITTINIDTVNIYEIPI